VEGKPVLVTSGKEQTAVDFKQPIRYLFRKRHDYVTAPIILSRILKPGVWQDIKAIKNILSEYVIIEESANRLRLRKL